MKNKQIEHWQLYRPTSKTHFCLLGGEKKAGLDDGGKAIATLSTGIKLLSTPATAG